LFHQRGDPDDARLGEVVERWPGGQPRLRPGQPVILGFPCDEGVRRNGGRPGAALAPDAIRRQLYRLTTWDRLDDVDLATSGILDLGNVRVADTLEEAQTRLGQVVGEVLRAGAVPIILGGGHETAYGHYLGFVAAGIECGILNYDAHLDVRSYAHGGHSGSPFRQAMEHPTQPLGRGRYVVVGAQRDRVARAHWQLVHDHGSKILWYDPETRPVGEGILFNKQVDYFVHEQQCPAIMLTIDADGFRQGDVPGTSAPSPLGFHGATWPETAYHAGRAHCIRSVDLVEVNPNFDRDDQTARWAAAGLRAFLVGLAGR
jgi:formiminoglutamase